MPKEPTVYDMRRAMRANGNDRNNKQEKVFGTLIDETLKFNRILYNKKTQFLVTIPDFMYEPKMDLVYFIDGKKIDIEVDGEYHETQKQTLSDQHRDARLTSDLKWTIHRIRQSRYELLWDKKFIMDFETLELYYLKVYEEVKEIFGFRMPLPQSLIIGILHTLQHASIF